MSAYRFPHPADMAPDSSDSSSPYYDSRADEADEDRRLEYREVLITCPSFIAELALENEEADRMAAAINGADMAEAGRIFTTALYREADDLIAHRADESGITPGEAAERMYEVYRPEPVGRAA